MSDEDAAPDWSELAAELMAARRTVLPKRLVAPGPDALALRAILGAAAHAPDHRQLLPWRLVQVPEALRQPLAEAFAQALLERDPDASPVQQDEARDKARRAPCLLMLVVDEVCGDPEIDLVERLVSAGCAVQNLLLQATAMGFGSALTSGRAMKSAALRRLFGLRTGEHAVCFVNLGTALPHRRERLRPTAEAYTQHLAAPGRRERGLA